MTEIDDRVGELEQLVADHDKRDEERFRAFNEAVASIRLDLAKLGKTIEDALSGDNERAGLRERVRVLERIEQDRKWALRILWAAVASNLIVTFFRVFTITGAAGQ